MMSLKEYPAFSDELKRIFGCKVQRISIDTALGCPHRNNSIGDGGCIFCGGFGSGAYSIARNLSITGQLEDGKEIMRRKYKASKFIAYFQAYTPTFTTPKKLINMLEEAASVSDIVGIIIASRPDTLPDKMLESLAVFATSFPLWLEIGMQSMHDRSLVFLNRGHDHACTRNSFKRATELGLRVCLHLILGIPGESKDDIMATIDEVNSMKPDGVKLHLLHVMKGTPLEQLYINGAVCLPERDEYVSIVCDVLDALSPDIFIHRLTGDGGRDNLVAPLWSLKKFEILNMIDAEMRRRREKNEKTQLPYSG